MFRKLVNNISYFHKKVNQRSLNPPNSKMAEKDVLSQLLIREYFGFIITVRMVLMQRWK